MTDGTGPHGPRWVSWLDDRVRAARAAVTEQGELVAHLIRWIVLGAASGVLAGLSSWVFLELLDRVTRLRVAHEPMLFLLPLAGLVIGSVYHYLGGRAREGNALLLDQIHSPSAWVPRRMAPLVMLGTLGTHLFGGSAGREGVGLQMSGSLTDWMCRVLRLSPDNRRLMLVAALAGGFGAMFGVPLAGAVFALEVQSIGRVRYEALVPALAASVVGNLVVHGLGYSHRATPQFDVGADGWLLARVAVAGLVFGLTAAAFVELTHLVKAVSARLVPWPPLRLLIGGGAVVGLALVFGREYLGLSLPLIAQGLDGEALSFKVFALKLVFTAVTIGTGFPGGEVTPLFVIGTTLGAALAGPLGLPVALLAAVGFAAVFAGAANTPLACSIMGIELFGAGAALPLAVGCVVAYVFSNHRGIYPTQRIHVSKGPRPVAGRPSLQHYLITRRPRIQG